MKIWKNALMLSVLVSLLVSTFAFLPSLVSAPSVATLAIDPALIEDETKGIGSTFQIEITVDDVEAMFGFNLFLYYDTDVLDVLTPEDFGSYYPFTSATPSEINDAEGYVSLGYSYPPPEYYGLTTTDPWPIVWVEFTVQGLGASQLNIRDSVISDVYGEEIVHTVVDGVFRNVLGCPLADFDYSPELPMEDSPVTFTSTSSDPDGYITNWAWNFGDGTTDTGSAVTHTYGGGGQYTVTLTVTDNDGKTDSYSRTIMVRERPLVGLEVSETKVTHYLLDYSKNGPNFKAIIKAWVSNLDWEKKALVRVVFSVHDADMANLGAIEVPTKVIPPLDEKLFQATFDYTEWGGWDIHGEAEWNIRLLVYYADYYITPTQPHWAGPQEPITIVNFLGCECPPVPVITITKTGSLKYLFDATGSYDPDEKWGDHVAQENTQWVFFDNDFNVVGLFYGGTKEFTFPGAGIYHVRNRMYDTFGARAETWLWDIEVTEDP